MGQIFATAQARSAEVDTVVKMSYLEIYNEQFYDLLLDAKQQSGGESGRLVDLAVRDDEVTGAVSVKGLSVRVVSSEEQALQWLYRGEANRARALHATNRESSRSHAICQVIVESRSKVESSASSSSSSAASASSFGAYTNSNSSSGDGGSGAGGAVVKVGKLSLVDLAGSERVGKTGSSGRVLQEAKCKWQAFITPLL